jgi:biopolymer transport protein ExbD
MNFREQSRSDVQLDITPIVDTVFNLLIFFALSLNFIVTPGIKVDLPESITEEIIRERDELIIVMNKDNAVFVDGRSISPESLTLLLTNAAQKSQETLVIIQADQDVSHGSVVRMMDRAKKAGLKRLAIATSAMKKEFL